MTNHKTINWRLGELGEEQKRHGGILRDIRENDLPHIKKEIVLLRAYVKGEMKSFRTILKIYTALNIAALVLAILVTKFLL